MGALSHASDADEPDADLVHGFLPVVRIEAGGGTRTQCVRRVPLGLEQSHLLSDAHLAKPGPRLMVIRAVPTATAVIRVSVCLTSVPHRQDGVGVPCRLAKKDWGSGIFVVRTVRRTPRRQRQRPSVHHERDGVDVPGVAADALGITRACRGVGGGLSRCPSSAVGRGFPCWRWDLRGPRCSPARRALSSSSSASRAIANRPVAPEDDVVVGPVRYARLVEPLGVRDAHRRLVDLPQHHPLRDVQRAGPGPARLPR